MIPETFSYLLLTNGSEFSCHVLEKLLQSNCPPVALVRSGFPPASFPDNTFIKQLPADRLSNLIKGTDIKVFHQTNSKEAPADFLQTISIDYILVVCYPWLVNPRIRSLAKIQAINLHPSLLPAYRGPDPVFWQLKNAEINTGISLHEMNERFDEGSVISQRQVDFSTYEDRSQLDEALALAGAEMFFNLIQGNDLLSVDVSLPASYNSFPRPEHFQIDLNRTAEQIYSFIRKTGNIQQLHWINMNGKPEKIRRVFLEHHLKQLNPKISKKGLYKQATEFGDIYLEIEN